jgi:VanZ family protein
LTARAAACYRKTEGNGGTKEENMADTWDRERTRKLIVRGLGWCLCVGLWTAALLTTYPVEVGKAVTPAPIHFPAAKLLHVSAYVFLTLFVSWLPLRRWRWLLLAFLSLHAAGTEYCQQFVPGRSGTAADVLIDHAGLVLGVTLSWKRWLPHCGNYLSLLRGSRSAEGAE